MFPSFRREEADYMCYGEESATMMTQCSCFKVTCLSAPDHLSSTSLGGCLKVAMSPTQSREYGDDTGFTRRAHKVD